MKGLWYDPRHVREDVATGLTLVSMNAAGLHDTQEPWVLLRSVTHFGDWVGDNVKLEAASVAGWGEKFVPCAGSAGRLRVIWPGGPRVAT